MAAARSARDDRAAVAPRRAMIADAWRGGVRDTEPRRAVCQASRPGARIISVRRGGIAQLGERLHGMQEVSGSIPLTSTTDITLHAACVHGRGCIQVPIV